MRGLQGLRTGDVRSAFIQEVLLAMKETCCHCHHELDPKQGKLGKFGWMCFACIEHLMEAIR